MAQLVANSKNPLARQGNREHVRLDWWDTASDEFACEHQRQGHLKRRHAPARCAVGGGCAMRDGEASCCRAQGECSGSSVDLASASCSVRPQSS